MLKTLRPKFAVLAALMTSRWVVYGFFDVALTSILRQAGASLFQISLILASGLLFMFKFLWAPIVDRNAKERRDHYKRWYIAAQSVLATGLAALLLLDPVKDFYVMFSVLLLTSVSATFRDIAMDGLAVRVLNEDERVGANGLMNAGFMLGLVLGGGVLLAAYPSVGWSGVVLALVACTVLGLPLVRLLAEPTHSADQEKVSFQAMLTAYFKVPGQTTWSAIIVVASIAGTVATSLISVMLVDLKWSLERIGLMMNTSGPLLAAAVSVLAAPLFTGMSRRAALLLCFALLAVSNASLVPVPGGEISDAAILAVVIASVVIGALTNQATKTIVIDKSAHGAHPATFATIQSSLSQIGGLISLVAAPSAAELFGYKWVIVSSVIVTAIVFGLTLVVRLDANQTKESRE